MAEPPLQLQVKRRANSEDLRAEAQLQVEAAGEAAEAVDLHDATRAPRQPTHFYHASNTFSVGPRRTHYFPFLDPHAVMRSARSVYDTFVKPLVTKVQRQRASPLRPHASALAVPSPSSAAKRVALDVSDRSSRSSSVSSNASTSDRRTSHRSQSSFTELTPPLRLQYTPDINFTRQEHELSQPIEQSMYIEKGDLSSIQEEDTIHKDFMDLDTEDGPTGAHPTYNNTETPAQFTPSLSSYTGPGPDTFNAQGHNNRDYDDEADDSRLDAYQTSVYMNEPEAPEDPEFERRVLDRAKGPPWWRVKSNMARIARARREIIWEDRIAKMNAKHRREALPKEKSTVELVNKRLSQRRARLIKLLKDGRKMSAEDAPFTARRDFLANGLDKEQKRAEKLLRREVVGLGYHVHGRNKRAVMRAWNDMVYDGVKRPPANALTNMHLATYLSAVTVPRDTQSGWLTFSSSSQGQEILRKLHYVFTPELFVKIKPTPKVNENLAEDFNIFPLSSQLSLQGITHNQSTEAHEATLVDPRETITTNLLDATTADPPNLAHDPLLASTTNGSHDLSYLDDAPPPTKPRKTVRWFPSHFSGTGVFVRTKSYIKNEIINYIPTAFARYREPRTETSIVDLMLDQSSNYASEIANQSPRQKEDHEDDFDSGVEDARAKISNWNVSRRGAEFSGTIAGVNGATQQDEDEMEPSQAFIDRSDRYSGSDDQLRYFIHTKIKEDIEDYLRRKKKHLGFNLSWMTLPNADQESQQRYYGLDAQTTKRVEWAKRLVERDLDEPDPDSSERNLATEKNRLVAAKAFCQGKEDYLNIKNRGCTDEAQLDDYHDTSVNPDATYLTSSQNGSMMQGDTTNLDESNIGDTRLNDTTDLNDTSDVKNTDVNDTTDLNNTSNFDSSQAELSFNVSSILQDTPTHVSYVNKHSENIATSHDGGEDGGTLLDGASEDLTDEDNTEVLADMRDLRQPLAEAASQPARHVRASEYALVILSDSEDANEEDEDDEEFESDEGSGLAGETSTDSDEDVEQAALSTDDVIKPLSPALAASIESSIKRVKANSKAKLVEGKDFDLAGLSRILPPRSDLPSQHNQGWLNDDGIDLYLEKVVDLANLNTGYAKRDLKRRPRNGAQMVNNKEEKVPPFVTFPTQWWVSMQAGGYGKVENWAYRRFIGGERLLESQLILFPVNLGGSHWTLLAIHPQARTIEVLNSLGEGLPGCQQFTKVRNYLQGELKDLYVASEWTEIGDRSNQQANMSDCGAFTCMNALALIRGLAPDEHVNAQKMIMSRHQIAATILSKEFPPELMW